MSTIKSSAENLTLNADGANNDIKFQSNGSEVASIDQAGVLIASGGVTVGSTSVADPVLLIQSSGSGDPQLNLSSAAANRSGRIRFLDNGSTAAGFINYTHNGNRMEFGSGSSTTIGFRVCDGYSNAAQGLTFGSDTAAANTLDDYEEGTWTPAWNTGSNGRSIANSGSYTKIGNRVHVSGYFVMGGNSNTGSGDVSFSGLPFTSSSTGNYRAATSSIWFHLATAANISGWVQDNSQLFYFRESGTTGDAADLGNHIDQNTFLFFAATYMV
jgi:hypothetical protein